ncbi:MAG: CotS family spore coat protein [Muricomes sp.]
MREYELEVLEQYEIEVKGTRKIRGAFFCETKEGTMLLKETDVSDRRAPLLYTVLCKLEEDGHFNVDTPIYNKEGGLVSESRDGSRYMLKKWYSGKECDVKREHEVLQAARNLAELHNKMQWSKKSEAGAGLAEALPTGRHLREEFLRHNRELKKVRTFTRNKVSKSVFEFLLLEYFEKMYTLAEQVTKRLEASGYDSLYRESIENGSLIHGDYNYHNVLFTSNGIATTNFEHFRVDVQAQDLYYFLRKVMEKHQWHEGLGQAMIEAYQSVRPLDSREMEYIGLCLAYPEKFWKTANTYYHSNKAWIPEKNVAKLETAITQTEEKLRFLENIFTFIL